MGKKHNHLTLEMRLEIYRLHAVYKSLSAVAHQLGVHKSTISREIRRNTHPLVGRYLPDKAQNLAHERRHRPGSKMGRFKVLQTHIADHIAMGWSPEVIAGRLKLEGFEHRISHESIYKWIYGEGKNRHLIQYLTRKKRRRGTRPSRKINPSPIPNRISIHDRPIEFLHEFGHWEADMIIFAGHKGGIVTLYERASKLTLGQKVSQKTADIVTEALQNQLAPLPKKARKSVTFDNGGEFSGHQEIHPLLSDKTYFCDAYASWQKGGVENTNGIIRRDVPKGSHAEDYTEEDISLIINHINNTPRKSIGFLTPIEKFNALCFNQTPLISPFFKNVAFQV
jgi:IS30 family transposase